MYLVNVRVHLVRERDPLLAGLRGQQRRPLGHIDDCRGAGHRDAGLLLRGRLQLQHLHVLADERGDLEGLRRRQDDLALLVVAARDDHEAVERRRVAHDAAVLVRAEGVARAVLQQVQPLLVHGQPEHPRPVRRERLLERESQYCSALEWFRIILSNLKL